MFENVMYSLVVLEFVWFFIVFEAENMVMFLRCFCLEKT
jgi:hypothetical protein